MKKNKIPIFMFCIFIAALNQIFGNALIVGIQSVKYKNVSKAQFRENPAKWMDEICYADLDILEKKMLDKKLKNTDFTMAFYIREDMKTFPVSEIERICYEDSWMNGRSYGGKRGHEGCDLIDKKNKRGEIKILSVCDGVVEKMGWLEFGGYRIGIRSEHNIYFYYAHMDRYRSNLKVGQIVKKGEVLGWMGDSGYGTEGTNGKFPVHLHFGIYITDGEQEYSVNPYPYLISMEKNKRKEEYLE